jgi:hypothetical protein
MAKKPAKKPKLDLLAEVARRAQSGEAPLSIAEIEGDVEEPEPEPVVKPRQTPMELIAAQDRSEWSLDDPNAASRLIRAIIENDGDFDAAKSLTACPDDVFYGILDDEGFEQQYKRMAFKMKALPHLGDAMQAAMKDGGAYGMSQALNASPKSDMKDEEVDKLRVLRAGGKQAYIRVLLGLQERIRKALLMLQGTGRLSPEEQAALVTEVAGPQQEAIVG